MEIGRFALSFHPTAETSACAFVPAAVLGGFPEVHSFVPPPGLGDIGLRLCSRCRVGVDFQRFTPSFHPRSGDGGLRLRAPCRFHICNPPRPLLIATNTPLHHAMSGEHGGHRRITRHGAVPPRIGCPGVTDPTRPDRLHRPSASCRTRLPRIRRTGLAPRRRTPQISARFPRGHLPAAPVFHGGRNGMWPGVRLAQPLSGRPVRLGVGRPVTIGQLQGNRGSRLD